MWFPFSRVFWGLLFLAIGTIAILSNVFGLDISIGDVFWPILLILIGLSILIRPRGVRTDHQVIFEEGKMKGKGGDYDIVFGSGQVDLTTIELGEKPAAVDVDVVFGKGEILINKDMPVLIRLESAFGNAVAPDGASVAFGNREYRSKSLDMEKPHLKIEANVVFGELVIREK